LAVGEHGLFLISTRQPLPPKQTILDENALKHLHQQVASFWGGGQLLNAIVQ